AVGLLGLAAVGLGLLWGLDAGRPLALLDLVLQHAGDLAVDDVGAEAATVGLVDVTHIQLVALDLGLQLLDGCTTQGVDGRVLLVIHTGQPGVQVVDVSFLRGAGALLPLLLSEGPLPERGLGLAAVSGLDVGGQLAAGGDVRAPDGLLLPALLLPLLPVPGLVLLL